MDEHKLRWAGRHLAKDILRKEIWSRLESSGIGVGKIWDSIPDFVSAQDAAKRLADLPFWKSARVIKCNPDAPQRPVRLQALADGKLLYMPVPELTKDFPFVLLDPVTLKEKGISLSEAASLEGALQHGKRVRFNEMLQMDVLVVGCVAAAPSGGRTGKGAGFADLELGIFRELKLMPDYSQIVTTVSDIQIVDGAALPLQPHDSPLDWIVTPSQAIKTNTTHPRPKGVAWEVVRPDQYENIPFLQSLRIELERFAK